MGCFRGGSISAHGWPSGGSNTRNPLLGWGLEVKFCPEPPKPLRCPDYCVCYRVQVVHPTPFSLVLSGTAAWCGCLSPITEETWYYRVGMV